MKKILIALALLIVGIQFIPAKRTNPAVIYDFDGPAEVKAILKRSCYDCHSYETDWPWYSHVAPMSWMVAHHVNDGRKHLNFSDWEMLGKMSWMRTEIYKEVAEGEMPLKSYLWLHPGARLTPEERAILQGWAVK